MGDGEFPSTYSLWPIAYSLMPISLWTGLVDFLGLVNDADLRWRLLLKALEEASQMGLEGRCGVY